MTIDLKEVAVGVERTIEIRRREICDTCKGSGAKAGSKPRKCADCGGYGQVQQQVAGLFGVSVRIMACPTCKGPVGLMLTNSTCTFLPWPI